MSDGRDVVYLYDGSFEGMLTAVFTAFSKKEDPSAILPDQTVQPCFCTEYRPISTEESKALRVANGVRRTMGQLAYEKIFTVYLSDDPAFGKTVLRYVRLGMQRGRTIHRMLTDDTVAAINKQADLVTREAHFFTEFARFSEREGGVYYAAIHPQYRILPLIVPHFFDRFRTHPFVMYDETHGEAGVSNVREWLIRDGSDLSPPAATTEERAYQEMWRLFYRTVSIKERENPALRRQLMPKKYWREMVEMRGE